MTSFAPSLTRERNFTYISEEYGSINHAVPVSPANFIPREEGGRCSCCKEVMKGYVEVKLRVEGMMCQKNCGTAVRNTLLKVPGVASAEASCVDQSATVILRALPEEKVESKIPRLIDAVEAIGFDAKTNMSIDIYLRDRFDDCACQAKDAVCEGSWAFSHTSNNIAAIIPTETDGLLGGHRKGHSLSSGQFDPDRSSHSRLMITCVCVLMVVGYTLRPLFEPPDRGAKFCTGDGRIMLNGFLDDDDICLTFLVETFVLSSLLRYRFAALVCFLCGILVEFLKTTVVDFKGIHIEPRASMSTHISQVITFEAFRTIEVALNTVLMMVVMSFDATLTLFIVFGMSIGHFYFVLTRLPL